MRKLYKAYLINFVVVLCFAGFLIYYAHNPFLGVSVKQLWFPAYLFFLGIILYVKWAILGSVGVLWLGVNLNVLSIGFQVVLVCNLKIGQMFPFLFLSVLIAFLVVGLISYDFFAIKICLNLIFPVISTFLLCFNVVQIHIFIVLLIISVIIGKMLNKLLELIFLHKRKIKNGKIRL